MFPSPKPVAPLRSISSRKNVSSEKMGLVNTWSRLKNGKLRRHGKIFKTVWVTGLQTVACQAYMKPMTFLRYFSQVVKHFIFHRTANMVEQFKQGMNSCGKLWETVERYWNAFQCLFTHSEGPLTRGAFRCLFDVIWSDKGTNNKEAEEDTTFPLECLLNSVQEKETPFTF
ncbi:hypothetical protein AOLI_G00137540 [Acnodon oligacanthus]